MSSEGVKYSTINLTGGVDFTADTLASGDRAFFQGVILPSSAPAGLSATERTVLRTFMAKFEARQLDAWDNDTLSYSTIGLSAPSFSGVLDGAVAQVTPAAKAAGFGYLNGPIPFSIGSFGHIAAPLAGYTSFVNSAPPAGGTVGSIMGVYSTGGVEQMVITPGFNYTFPQFKYLAHGAITWLTRGVHFGYNRNNFSFHFDDAFAEDSLWDPTLNCTPGEDCFSVPATTARMTAADVVVARDWSIANGYTMTLPFNASYAVNGDALTTSFVANKASFRWLNHGFEHIYQGCVQNTAVTPWVCQTGGNGAIQYVTQSAIVNEIQNNINRGNQLGLSFDDNEYLSGEHSGLQFTSLANPPVTGQNQLDNPRFIAAMNQLGINSIGADASREPTGRIIGNATKTIPRHPTILYYNTANRAQAVDEYNHIYGTTLTAPSDFENVMVKNDAAFDLGFILSNDPRPFYAHVTNLVSYNGEAALAYPLLDAILGTYRTVFTAATPVVNLTQTQAANELARQQQWAVDINSVSGYIQNGVVSITHNGTPLPAGRMIPFTAPAGTVMAGNTFEAYGGEWSAWLTARAATFSSANSANGLVGSPFSFTVTTANGLPTTAVSAAGALPAGLTFVDNRNGTATISGTPTVPGVYPLTLTATTVAGSTNQAFTLSVNQGPQFTSPAVVAAIGGVPFSFTITTNGFPAPAITRSGALPSGLTFVNNGNGTATISGTPALSTVGQSFPIALTATNSVGVANQAFVLNVAADASLKSLTPFRLADTRPGMTTGDGLYAGEGIRDTGSTLELLVAGRGGVPADATAVALNVTVAEPIGSGFVTVFPCGSTQPTASSLNYTAGAVVPNAVIAKLGTDGKVCLFVSNAAHLVVDVNGYFPLLSSFVSMNPARVLETRSGLTTIDGLQNGEGIRGNNAITTLHVANRADVPASATAVVLNVTVTEATGAGFVTVYPCGTIPTASNINYGTDATVANMVIAKLDPNGDVCLYNNAGTHLVVDVNGYFPNDGMYQAIVPARLLESRADLTTTDGLFNGGGILANGTITELTVAGRGGVNADAKTAVLNVTVTEAAVAGFITVYPCGTAIPLASNLNYGVGTTVAGAAIAQIPAGGKVCLFNSGSTHLIVDVNGYLLN